MAELKVRLTGDISSYEHMIHKAKEQAKELGESFKEVGLDLGKSISGFDIGKALGIGGAVYAAGKLGDALIDAAKEGYKAFQDYQDAVLRFKYTLPSSSGTMEERGEKAVEIQRLSEDRAGVFTEGQLEKTSLSLMQGDRTLSQDPEKLGAMMDTVQALAIKTGGDPEAIAENIRKLNLGIKEERGGAAGKFMKSTPGLEEETLKLRDEEAGKLLKSFGGDKSKLSDQQAIDYQKLAEASAVEFMTHEGDTKGSKAVLEEMAGILERSAPKRIIEDAQAIHPEGKLAAAWENLFQDFGKELKPAIDDFVNELVAAMPTIKDDFIALADGLNMVIPVITFFAKVVEGVNDMINIYVKAIADGIKMWTGIDVIQSNSAAGKSDMDRRREEITGEGHEKETYDRKTHAVINDATHESGLYFGEGTGKKREEKEEKERKDKDATSVKEKEKALAAKEELDLINAKASAEQSGAAGRLAMESRSLEIHEQARNAARAVMSQVNPADKSVQGQEANVAAELEEKRIRIQEEADQKILRNKADLAEKTAKIEADQAERQIKRGTGPAKDDATKKIWAAEDAASENQKIALQDASNQKIIAENQDAADKIIDAQEAAAKSRAEIEYNAAIKAIDKMKGPYSFARDEGPEHEQTYSKFSKGGHVIEGSYERGIREQKNKAGEEAAAKANEEYKEKLRAAALARELAATEHMYHTVGSIGSSYGIGQPAALTVESHTDASTGLKSSSFDFGKGVTEQQKTNLILKELYDDNKALLAIFSGK